ncbi:MAG: hypothetical protein HYV60_14950 [Planctomycetia bacterium]|nr:hypothetical protein [Planctomycetia bacterium]
MNKKLGAPPKDPEKRKSNVVQIRLTDLEKEQCEQAAELDGAKMSQWARDTLVRTANRRIKRG